MKQLTEQDAVFLSIETSSLPAHIGGLAFLEPVDGIDFSFESFQEFIRQRLGGHERFGCRVQQVPFGLDRPYWVHVDHFDPADHLMQIGVPAPYSPESLGRLVGRIFERPLDKTRPLWEMTLIEGLPGGGYVLLWKMHHCMMDGASGAGLVEQLFDMTADAVRPPSRAGRLEVGGEPRDLEVALRAIGHAMELPRRQAKYVRQALAPLTPSLSPRDALEKLSQLIQQDEPGPDPMPERELNALAPNSLFNGFVGPHRGIAWSTVSLDEVKRVKNAMSVTVNDVVLALTAGAVRGFLEERGALPEDSLIASVPVSTRKAGDDSVGNQVSDMSVYWGTDIEDPVERLLAIHKDASAAKGEVQRGESLNFMGVLSEALLPGALSLLMKGIERAADRAPLPANTVVSNVPMAPFPLYCAGAKLAKTVPISMLAPTQGMNITVLSYCGELHFGLVYDPDLVSDVWELVERIPKSLQALQESVDRWQLSHPDLED